MYQTLSDPPKSVKGNLQNHAQEIYRNAFNAAVEQYSDAENTRERAHKVAWSAVKEKYQRDGEEWHKK